MASVLLSTCRTLWHWEENEMSLFFLMHAVEWKKPVSIRDIILVVIVWWSLLDCSLSRKFYMSPFIPPQTPWVRQLLCTITLYRENTGFGNLETCQNLELSESISTVVILQSSLPAIHSTLLWVVRLLPSSSPPSPNDLLFLHPRHHANPSVFASTMPAAEGYLTSW